MSIDIEVDNEEAIKMTEYIIYFFDSRIIGADANEKLGAFIVDKLRSEIQNEGHVVTGEMLSETQVLEVGDDYVIVGNPTLQARILELGRVEIRSDNVLHWVDPDSGEDVFSHFSAAVPATRLFIKTIKAALDDYVEFLSNG